MRHLTVKLMIVAMTLGAGHYALSTTAMDQSKASVESMTVAQLEAAGDTARTNKNYDEAIRYFEAAIRKDSRNPVLYNKLGLAQLKSENLSDARASFQKSAKLNSKFADPVNNLGAIEYMQKHYASAAKYFKKAVALDEAKATFHVNLGATWFAQKKLEQAFAEYARALELNPDALATSNSGVQAQIASPEERAKYAYMLAKIYATRGQYDECMQSLRKAKEEGYKDLANVYKDAEFAQMRHDPRLAEIVGPPAK
jgi:tetratricopeptide (TPR) repeat protein